MHQVTNKAKKRITSIIETKEGSMNKVTRNEPRMSCSPKTKNKKKKKIII